MFSVGDVVSYKDDIGVVQIENPLQLALNTGMSVCGIPESDCTLLADYKTVLSMFATKGVSLYNG
jgi:hypothetical protein